MHVDDSQPDAQFAPTNRELKEINGWRLVVVVHVLHNIIRVLYDTHAWDEVLDQVDLLEAGAIRRERYGQPGPSEGGISYEGCVKNTFHPFSTSSSCYRVVILRERVTMQTGLCSNSSGRITSRILWSMAEDVSALQQWERSFLAAPTVRGPIATEMGLEIGSDLTLDCRSGV